MRKISFLVLFICFGLQIQASNGKYRLTLRDNPSTSIVIGWDQTSGNNPVVHFGTIDFGTNHRSYPFTKSPDRAVSYKGMNNHFARLTGLQPNTAYYFVIRDSQGTSERFWFKTAPADNSRLSFIAGGDSRNNRLPRQNANRLVAKLKPHAVLFGGDMTDNDTNSQWRDWFNDWQLTIANDNRIFPIIAARGNHEGSNNSIYHLFDVPSSSVYYALTFGNNLVRTYTLNTEISISGNQTTWLQNDLNANTNVIWKMAQYHKPMRPHVSSKREGNSQYSNWAQLFYDKEVKLVVECDAHTVKTTWPVRPSTSSGSDEGFRRDDQNGTVYVGEGCWGAPLRSNNDSKSWTRNSARFNQFKWIFIDENKIETRTIKVDNASQVASVSNENPFSIPNNLDIWNPSNGRVVTIHNTSIADNEAPTNPTNLVSVNSTNNSISLSWHASSDNIRVSGYEVYQGNNKIGNTFNTTYTVNGLSENTTYSFKITAKDEAGNFSGFSNVRTVTTLEGSSNQYTLGITTVGDRNSTHSSRRAMPFTMNENGTLQSISFHVEGGSGNVHLGIYADANGVPGNRLATTAMTPVRSTRGWQTISLQNEITISRGSTIWIAWIFSNNPGIAYVSGSPGRFEAGGSQWSSNETNMPANYGSGSQNNYRYSVYATYTKNTSTGGEKRTLDVAVSSGNDDVEEDKNGDLYTDSSDLELVYDSHNNSSYQTIGLRFRSVTIPANAVITNAYLQFTADESHSAGTELEISLHNSADSPQFSSSNNVSGRTTFSDKVIWRPISWTRDQSGNAQRSPDLKNMLQNLINRTGWTSGNSLSFIVKGRGNSLNSTSAKRVADSYEGGSDKAARLIVEYISTSKSRMLTDVAKPVLEENFVKVFPNPFTDTVTFTSSPTLHTPYTVEIRNMNGTIIYKEKIVSHQQTIYPTITKVGIYLISIIGENNEVLEIKRLVKK